MGKLYLVGTPIGNLSDLSPRAAETLAQVDFIAAEDTRVTLKLLSHIGVKKPMVSYHEHNVRQKSQSIVDRMLAGEDGAIVTDAGMPCISDPGEVLVAACHEAGVEVVVVPGPSAVIAALAASGLATTRFCFEGFLSAKKNSRREHLSEIKSDPRTLVFYEAPHKLVTTLEDMLAAFGDRRLTICRELTKLYEEIWPATLSVALARYRETAPRGEFVLVVEGAAPVERAAADVDTAVDYTISLAKDGLSLSEAAKQAGREMGWTKGELYRQAAKRLEETERE